MPVFNGTSAQGDQTVATAVPSLTGKISIQMINNGNPPYRRVGYFYLSVTSVGFFPGHRLIKRGVIYSPGIYDTFNTALSSSGDKWRLDVYWNVSGAPYSVSLT